jgi:hypothetical protein
MPRGSMVSGRPAPGRRRDRLAWVLWAMVGAGLLAGGERATAAVLPVIRCDDVGQPGDLRGRILSAVEGDVVTVPACTVILTSTLSISTAISLQGSGPGRTVLDGSGLTRVLSIAGGAQQVRIADLSIRNATDDLGGSGAGLYNNGNTVILERVEVRNNRSTGGAGAGVFNAGGSHLTLLQSRLAGNDAPQGLGGGLYNNGGVAVLVETTVIDNHADGGSAEGGGIFNSGGASLVLVRSLVVGNTSEPGLGGGLFDGGGRLMVASSTFQGNSATRGGGLHLSPAGVGALAHATISGNLATEAGGALAATGATEVSLRSTLLGLNTATAGRSCSAGGLVASSGHNLVDDDTCGLGGTGDREEPGLDVGLESLADNGGPTRTRALLEGSPALDAADAVGCPGLDQRGIARPQREGCDVGAFEAEPPPPPPPPVNPLTLSPPSGAYLSTQLLDFTVILALPGRTVVSGQALLDGVDVTGPVVACVRPGSLLAGGQTFNCPGVVAGLLGPGSHTVVVSLQLDDGTSVSQSVVWEVLPASGS